MLRKVTSQISRRPQTLLGLFATIAAIANIHLGRTLIGWDSLQTDLNPLLAIKRAFFASWQEYQSFGLPAGMAHASDLVRALLTALPYLLLPQSIARYAQFIALFAVGGYGAYYLFQKLFGKEKSWIALSGALFYMVNLGTLQIFALPFEPFSWFFASLPWLLLTCHNVLTADKEAFRKQFFFALLVNILATPSYYLQTLFVVYAMSLSMFMLGALLISKKKVEVLQRSIGLGICVILIQLFWLLPQAYFLKHSNGVVRESKINQLATEDVYYQNREKGTLRNFLTMEGFYYDLIDTHQDQLFAPWKHHLDFAGVQIVQLTLIGIVVLGFASSKKRSIPFYLMLIPITILLLPETPGLGFLNGLLRHVGLIDQMFRSPFTKLVIPYSLCFSYFFALGVGTLGRFGTFEKKIKITVFILLVIYAFPLFTGHLFADSMFVKLPIQYHSVIAYFKNQPKDARIALLPDYTFWGWFITNTGYNGSGFLWYGIEQPIVSRTFDVWSYPSESYFWELKQAVDAQDGALFEQVLKKYDISYLVYDPTLLPVVSTVKGIQYGRLEQLLNTSSFLEKDQVFGSLAVYKRKDSVPGFIKGLSNNPLNTGPAVKRTNLDGSIWHLPYQTTERPDVYFPFADLFSQVDLIDKKWNITEDDSSIIVTANLPDYTNGYALEPTNIDSFSAQLYQQDKPVGYNGSIEIDRSKNLLTLKTPKILVTSITPSQVEVGTCVQKGSSVISKNGTSLTVTSSDRRENCFGYSDDSLSHEYGYLVSVKASNRGGRSFFMYIEDQTKQQSYIEDRLNTDDARNTYYLLPPRYAFGKGYSFVFTTNSYLGSPSTNTLSELKVYLIPYGVLKELRLVNGSPSTNSPEITSLPYSKFGYHHYTISDIQNSSMIALSQAFDPGWRAYDAGGNELPKHVRINTWANGWDTQGVTGEVTLIYWPQYLEYLGLGVIVLMTLTSLLSLKTRD